jgi:hypothetical protein
MVLHNFEEKGAQKFLEIKVKHILLLWETCSLIISNGLEHELSRLLSFGVLCFFLTKNGLFVFHNFVLIILNCDSKDHQMIYVILDINGIWRSPSFFIKKKIDVNHFH